MKRLFLTMALLFFILMSASVYSLDNFNYTGIAFDGNGTILDTRTVSVQIELIESGNTLYTETHSAVTTDQFGAYTVEVGNGTTGDNLSAVSASKNLRIKSTVTFNGSSGVWVVSSVLKPTVAITGGSNNLFWKLGGNSNTAPGTNFIGTVDDKELHLDVRNSTSVEQSLRINTNQAIYRESSITGISAGNSRGQYAVDLQIYRANANQVASGMFSIISGGRQNRSSEWYSTVGGGYQNTASGSRATIGGGSLNASSEWYSTVSGGYENTASKYATTVGGGFQNTASGERSTVSGGSSNTASGDFSTVGGGVGNTAPSYGETVIGLYATDYTPNSTDAFDADDRLFNIGNGTADASRSDAFTVYKSGNATLYGSLSVTKNLLPSGSGTQRIGLATNNWDWLHVKQARIYTDFGMSSTAVIVSDLNPETGVAHNLGSSTRRWATVFVGTSMRMGASGNEGTMGFNGTSHEFTFDKGINVTGDMTASADLTANGNITLGDDATADVTTMNSAFVPKYNSNNSGANFTIPDGTMVMYITSPASNDTWTATLPSGTNGQIIYTYYVENGADNFSITNGTTTWGAYTSDQNLTFVYANGAWRLF